MKKLALVLALTMAAFAGSAFASDWFSDNVGVYFDEAASSNCGTAAPYTPFPAFLVLTQITAPDVNAFEVALTFDNVVSLGFAARGNAIDAGILPGEHLVGFASPQPVVGGAVVVADLQLMVQNTNAAGIGAGGVFFHTLASKIPAYQGSTTEVRELHPISPAGSPIMVINGGCVVGAETTSFGEVKSLFR